MLGMLVNAISAPYKKTIVSIRPGSFVTEKMPQEDEIIRRDALFSLLFVSFVNIISLWLNKLKFSGGSSEHLCRWLCVDATNWTHGKKMLDIFDESADELGLRLDLSICAVTGEQTRFFNLKVDGKNLAQVDWYKYLGVLIMLNDSEFRASAATMVAATKRAMYVVKAHMEVPTTAC